jgi:hypothetical protein
MACYPIGTVARVPIPGQGSDAGDAQRKRAHPSGTRAKRTVVGKTRRPSRSVPDVGFVVDVGYTRPKVLDEPIDKRGS